jgi:F420-dependent oxidoreductase-like protein
MRIGIMIGEGSGAPPDLEATIERARLAEAAGLDSVWIAQIRLDAVAAAAAVGRETGRVEIGTAVVPIPPIHPLTLALAAATAQQACGGRFTLGIGLSHKVLVENVLGLSYEKPLSQMREYLDVLGPVLAGEGVKHEGARHRVVAQPIGRGTPVPVLLAALGPNMLALAGMRAGGTITWATGPRTIGEYVAPTLATAAEAAGRPAPRIVAGVPVCVTDDAAAARDTAARVFAAYRDLPSYRGMLDREDVGGVEDLAVVGDEASVRTGLDAYAKAGTTDLCAFPFAAEADGAAEERTRALLGELAREGR